MAEGQHGLEERKGESGRAAKSLADKQKTTSKRSACTFQIVQKMFRTDYILGYERSRKNCGDGAGEVLLFL